MDTCFFQQTPKVPQNLEIFGLSTQAEYWDDSFEMSRDIIKKLSASHYIVANISCNTCCDKFIPLIFNEFANMPNAFLNDTNIIIDNCNDIDAVFEKTKEYELVVSLNFFVFCSAPDIDCFEPFEKLIAEKSFVYFFEYQRQPDQFNVLSNKDFIESHNLVKAIFEVCSSYEKPCFLSTDFLKKYNCEDFMTPN